MQFAQVDLSQVSLSNLVTGKGCKTAAASYNGAPCKFLLSQAEWFSTPFGASTYDKDPGATRLTMEMDVTGKDAHPLLQALDRWVVEHVIQNNLFEGMSREDVAKQYHSCLQFSEKYNSHRLRTKVNVAGMTACKWFHHETKDPLAFGALDLRQSVIQPVIHFKGLWKQSTQWGVSLDVVKALVDSNGSDAWDF